MENKAPIRSKTTEMLVDNCRYIVTTHFKENGRETADQKMLRYVSGRIADEMSHTGSAGLLP